MALDLVDVFKTLAKLRGTTVDYEIARHNIRIMEDRIERVRTSQPLPAASREEREARAKASRKRAVDRAREKRQAARSSC